MIKIKVQPLSKEAFAPYGEYTDLLCPDGHALTGELHAFYPDRLLQRVNANLAFSPIVVKKPAKYIVEMVEHHTTTAEVIMPLDDDAIIHVAQPSGLEPIPEQTKAFFVPKGTIVKLNAAVWHLCPLPVHNDTVTSMIALPECIYANDLKVAELDDEHKIELIF